MPRPTVGSVIEHRGKDGRTYRSLRFVAYGKRRRVPLGPVSVAEAEVALRHVIADVERGTWKAPVAPEPPAEQQRVPTFGEFGMEWWTLTKGQFAESTQADYWWRLTVHLAPYFNELRLDEITFDVVERYMAGKLAGVIYEGGREAGKGEPFTPRSINMFLTLLGQILEARGRARAHPAQPGEGPQTEGQGTRAGSRRTSSRRTRSRRCSTRPGNSTRKRRAAKASTSNAGRRSRRSCSRACASARCSRCAGRTSTSLAAGSRWATRRLMRADAKSRSAARCATSCSRSAGGARKPLKRPSCSRRVRSPPAARELPKARPRQPQERLDATRSPRAGSVGNKVVRVWTSRRTREAHAAQPPAHVLLAALRPRLHAGRGHAGNGPHRPEARAARSTRRRCAAARGAGGTSRARRGPAS